MVATYTEKKNIGDVIAMEFDQAYCRELGTVKAGQNLAIGAVVALETATTKYVEYNPAGSGGTNVVAGILLQFSDATTGDLPKQIIEARGPVIAKDLGLVWKSGATAPQIAAGTAALAVLGIVARAQV